MRNLPSPSMGEGQGEGESSFPRAISVIPSEARNLPLREA